MDLIIHSNNTLLKLMRLVLYKALYKFTLLVHHNYVGYIQLLGNREII